MHIISLFSKFHWEIIKKVVETFLADEAPSMFSNMKWECVEMSWVNVQVHSLVRSLHCM